MDVIYELRQELARITNRFESFSKQVELNRLDRAAIQSARNLLDQTETPTAPNPKEG